MNVKPKSQPEGKHKDVYWDEGPSTSNCSLKVPIQRSRNQSGKLMANSKSKKTYEFKQKKIEDLQQEIESPNESNGVGCKKMTPIKSLNQCKINSRSAVSSSFNIFKKTSPQKSNERIGKYVKNDNSFDIFCSDATESTEEIIDLFGSNPSARNAQSSAASLQSSNSSEFFSCISQMAELKKDNVKVSMKSISSEVFSPDKEKIIQNEKKRMRKIIKKEPVIIPSKLLKLIHKPEHPLHRWRDCLTSDLINMLPIKDKCFLKTMLLKTIIIRKTIARN